MGNDLLLLGLVAAVSFLGGMSISRLDIQRAYLRGSLDMLKRLEDEESADEEAEDKLDKADDDDIWH